MELDRHLNLLRQHLDKHGFSDIEVRFTTGKYHPDKTPLGAAIVKAARQAAETVYGLAPLVFPGVDTPSNYPEGSYAELGPGSLRDLGPGVIAALGVPWIECYYGDPESFNHAPNEFLSIEAFRRANLYVEQILELFPEQET